MLLLALAASAEHSGTEFTYRSVVVSSTTFRDCTFRGCRAMNTSGGALLLDNASVTLSLSACLFSDCSASLDGGGLFCGGCRSLLIDESMSMHCAAGSSGGFCRALASSLKLTCTSATLSSSAAGTLHLSHSISDHAEVTLELVNSSSNYAKSYASAIGLGDAAVFAVRFCALSANGGGGCLSVGANATKWDIFCLAVINNTCDSESDSPGLIFVAASVSLSCCLFRANSYDAFVGCPRGRTCSVTFDGCVFDRRPPPAPVWKTTRCSIRADLAMIAECGSRTQIASTTRPKSATASTSRMRSRSRARTPAPSLTAPKTRTRPASETPAREDSGHSDDAPSTAVAVGIAVGCVAGVALLVVAIVALCRWAAANNSKPPLHDMYDEGGRSPILERQTARQWVREIQRT